MSDLIRREDEAPTPTAMSRTEFKPSQPIRNPNSWSRFVSGLRQFVTGYCMELANRWGESQVAKEEAVVRKLNAEAQGLELDNESKHIDNQMKLWEARQKFEAAQKPQPSTVTVTQPDIAPAAADAQAAEAIADPELAAYAADLRRKSPDELRQEMVRLIQYISDCGGAVEIAPPDKAIPDSSEADAELSPTGVMYRRLVRDQFPDAVAVILYNEGRKVIANLTDHDGKLLGEGTTEDAAWQNAASRPSID